MKIRIPVFIGWILLFLSGCYKDKGEYDYTPLNWIEIDYLPSDYISIDGDRVVFQYRQPLTDTQYMSVMPVLKQNLTTGDGQVAYYWINTSGGKDTLKQKEFHYKLLPREETKIKRLLKISDLTTDIDYYRTVEITTVPPYKDQWFVLHGEEGDRRLGAAENMDGRPLVTRDCYEVQHGVRRFRNAIGLSYASLGQVMVMKDFEVLKIFEPDSCFTMYPFLMRVDKVNQEMLLNVDYQGIEFQKVIYNESGNGFFGVVTNYGLLLAAWNDFSAVGLEEGIGDYTIDEVYIAAGGYATIWDRTNRRFLFYKFESGKVNKLALVNQKLFEGVELKDKDCRALLASTFSPRGCMAIMQDENNSYWYELNYAWEDGKLPGSVEAGGTLFRQDTLKNISFDENSCFTANGVFTNQFFYSVGDKVYHYNMLNHENKLLYDAQGGNIDILFFKSYEPGYSNKRPEFARVLGIAVNYPEGKGELHEVSLTTSGEVGESIVYEGFGRIADLISAKGL